MKETISPTSEIQHHNDDEAIKSSGIGKSEKTKRSLQHIRKIHKIKSDGLGYCYSILGDSAWQILCEVYLHNLENAKIDIAKIQRSISVSLSIAERYLAVLQAEMLIEKPGVGGRADCYSNLSLTNIGRSKVQSILDECTEAFTSIFIYSQPYSVVED